jgi:hypothetical protein
MSGPDFNVGRGDLLDVEEPVASQLIAEGRAELSTEPEQFVGVVRRPQPMPRRRRRA